MKPNLVGSKSIYLNPTMSSKITTANIAAIASTGSDFATMSPYAYTATVRSDYDTCNFIHADAGADLATAKRVSYGIFIAPQNEKGNLFFQLSGKAHFFGAGHGRPIFGGFFFGRRAMSNTVVSSLASVNNTLDKFIYLPSDRSGQFETTYQLIEDSYQNELFTVELTGGFVYCFGFFLDNTHSATALTLRGGVSLAARAFTSAIPYFSPVGGM